MALWNFYFLAKLYLFLSGASGFHGLLNLLLFAYAAAPLPEAWAEHKRVPVFKAILGAALGTVLFWHDSYLPPFREAFAFAADPALRPTPSYIFQFLLGYWSFSGTLILAGLLAACVASIRFRLRLSALTLAGIAVISIYASAHRNELEPGSADAFYAAQAKQSIRFEKIGPREAPFDIVMLHVCSLAWDDLRTVRMEQDEFLAQFDVLFTSFNSVTSYSNPAALRLLRANCGQTPHDSLYRDAPNDCYLIPALKRAGYATYSVFNHDGKYSDMAADIVKLGRADPITRFSGLPAEEKNFDDAQILGNFASLEAWRRLRQESGARRAALYYNTLSLHDGAHGLDERLWWKRDRTDHYREMLRRVLGELSRFMAEIRASDRNTVVVFIPEHGAALRGSKMQVRGLRDIPLPQITMIPVGVALIGAGHAGKRPQGPAVISRPSSYLAVAYLLSEFLKNSPFNPDWKLSPAILQGAPSTPFLAENQYSRVIARDKALYWQSRGGEWRKLTGSQSAD